MHIHIFKGQLFGGVFLANGATRLAIGWTGVIVTAAMGFLQFITGFQEATWICCGFFLLFLFILNSGSEAKKKVTLLVAPSQTPTQQVIHHTHVHHQSPPTNDVSSPPSRFNQPVGTAIQWETEARNLELARDWEKAAEAFQKAGLYSEAGRIRKDHLENDESQVKIHVDRIGHNIQDSVYMEDSDKKNN